MFWSVWKNKNNNSYILQTTVDHVKIDIVSLYLVVFFVFTFVSLWFTYMNEPVRVFSRPLFHSWIPLKNSFSANRREERGIQMNSGETSLLFSFFGWIWLKLNISKSLFFVSVFVVLLFLFSFSKLIRHLHSMILYGYSSHNNQASYSATNVVDLWIVRNNRVLICKILDLHGRYQCFTFFIYICIFMYIRILKLASAANSARFFFFRIWKQTKEARSIERTREIFDWAIEYFVTVCG